MPTITEPKNKKESKGSNNTSPSIKPLLKTCAIATMLGGVLGLSAPGIDQWYIAWLGVAPLIMLIAGSGGVIQATLIGLCFGTGYNLVYDNWLLGLQPLSWLGFNWWQGALLASAACIFMSVHQGLITAMFAFFCRLIPMTSGFLPKKSGKGFAVPTLLTIPLLWVLIHHIIGNAHDALGVPWTMLEYSQYQQHHIIQMASVTGGIGICFLIVMWNTALASLITALWKKKSGKMLLVGSSEHAYYYVLAVALILAGFLSLGFYEQSQNKVVPTLTASAIQGNINIDMQKTEHRYTLSELWRHYAKLVNTAPPGLCVWSEGSLPTYLRSEPSLISDLAQLAAARHLDLIIGSIDRDMAGHPYNAAYGVTSDGKLLEEVYHKRYLVPFGEYTPLLVEYFPAWIKRLTNTPAGGGYTAGKRPVVLHMKQASVAPLICFETLSPEIVASSVRAGGQVLVNVSDVAWFHQSIVGRQMIAFAVMRSVENRRYFIFAANTGPSAIIDSDGYIRRISELNKSDVLSGKVGLNSRVTPFTSWFVF